LTCGEFDEARPQTVALFQDLIPGARMHVFDGASHSHMLEQPEQACRIISSFISSAESQQIQ